MKISIFGLGYVGCVSAACLAYLGHEVVGIDVVENKVNLINEGRPTIVEKHIQKYVKEARDKAMLRATLDVKEAVLNTELSMIAVGTPTTDRGHLDLTYVYHVAQHIGESMKDKDQFHIIALRSTVLPGTNDEVGKIIEEFSGKKRNEAFAVVSNPEFLREGTAVDDYFNPPLTLIGSDNAIAKEKMLELYKDIPGEKVTTEIRVAEIMKYVNNTYHALKIVFGNEIGNICKALEIDSHEVMRIFCMDKQLNISPYYFKPGFAYGGSCLPKDTEALTALARDNHVGAPIISKIRRSNELQIENAIKMILDKNIRKVGILGLSFKAGTDDLRNSPIVEVVERLLGKGFMVKIYDKNVKISELTGTNKDFIHAKIPHLQEFITDDLASVMEACDLVVVTNPEEEFKGILKDYPNKTIIDLVRLWKTVDYEGTYEGISWKI